MVGGQLVEPACHADARALLERRGRTVKSIVRVYPDAILYISSYGPMTTWLKRDGDNVEMCTRHGFQAYPPEDAFQKVVPSVAPAPPAAADEMDQA